MPSKTKKQHKFMEAVANNPSFARMAKVPQSVGVHFINEDKRDHYGSGFNQDHISFMEKAKKRLMKRRSNGLSLIKKGKGLKNQFQIL
jgi:hypothetical protein